MRIKKNTIIAALIIFAALYSSGCSSEKNTLLSISYHNLTAHYNAYYYARNGIRSVESEILKNHKDDYDHFLPVYPPLDTTFTKQFEETLNDVVKKTSLAIVNHGNSKWVDDSYDLLGLARLYTGEFESAIETFKWVNKNSKDGNMRHLSLIHLCRTFVEYGELNNAEAVSDFLEKEDLNKRNLKKLYLTRAYLYQEREDLDKMVYNLSLVVPLLKKKEGSAKIYFIIGQIYQHLGFQGEAFNNYRKCLANNPTYELSFFAKLNMAQVTELSNTSDVKRVRKYFKKLVTDAKNIEFQDKIYYEMGEFELKQGNVDLAFENYTLSVQNSISNQRQKGLSYLRMGQVNYDSLRNFEKAQSYYDSTIQVMPNTFEYYEEVVKRKDVLDRFVTKLKTIQLQDSLLALSRLDTAELSATFINQVKSRIENEKKEIASKKTDAGDNTVTNTFQTQGINTSSLTWYFTNPSAISLGQNEFKKTWGGRPLEDDWRRSSKSAAIVSRSNPGSSISAEEESKPTVVSEDQLIASEVASMIKNVPFSKEDKESALAKIEEAYYQLGKIYHLELHEADNAITNYRTFLSRFPESEFEPEVLYTLYLILKEKEDPQYISYENQLKQEHPNSTYTRLIVNPNYALESSVELGELRQLYAKAYEQFDNGNFGSARILISEALASYDENEFYASFRLLDILITGKSEDLALYKNRLRAFIENYPDSDVTTFAKTLLEKAENFEQGIERAMQARFIMFTQDEHYFVILVNTNDEGILTKLTVKVDSVNREIFQDQNLKTGILDFEEGWRMIVVSELNSKSTAVDFYDKILPQINLPAELRTVKFHNFIITKDNFDILYNSKDLDAYLKFFNESY